MHLIHLLPELIPAIDTNYSGKTSQIRPSKEFISCVTAAYGKYLTAQLQQSPSIPNVIDGFCAIVRVAAADKAILATPSNTGKTTIEPNELIIISNHNNVHAAIVAAPPHARLPLALISCLPDTKYVMASDRNTIEHAESMAIPDKNQKPPVALAMWLINSGHRNKRGNIAVNMPHEGFIVAARNLEFLRDQTTKIRPASTLGM